MKTKKIFILLFITFLFNVIANASKNSVRFNAMVNNKKSIERILKNEDGIKNVKINEKLGTIDIIFDDSKTNISQINNTLSNAGIYASPVGENCATKPGGCLNNAPKTTNTMK